MYKLELKQQQGCEVTAASIFWMLLNNLGCCRLHVHAVKIQSQVRNLCDFILPHRVLVQSCLRTADPVNAIQQYMQCKLCRGLHGVCRWQGEVRNQDCSHAGSHEGVHHQVPESHAHTVLCQLPVQQPCYPQVAINTHQHFLPASQDRVRLSVGCLGSS